MFHQSGTDLTKIPAEQVKTWLNSFDTVLTDCDGMNGLIRAKLCNNSFNIHCPTGVVWMQNDAIAGSPDVINRFVELGKKVFFITNNSTKTRSELLKKALGLGFNITEEGILSTSWAAAKYLQNRKFNKKVYIVGTTGISQELDLVGIRHSGVGPDVLTGSMADLVNGGFQPDPEVGAVIVGFDEHFSYPKMLKAGTYLNDPKVTFIATNTDAQFPAPACVVPGTGCIVSAIEVCAQRKPIIMGKPETSIAEPLFTEHGIVAGRTLMIGDRGDTDILLGTRCKLQTLLVGTGIHNLKDVADWKVNGTDEWKQCIPDVFLPKLGDLLPFMV